MNNFMFIVFCFIIISLALLWLSFPVQPTVLPEFIDVSPYAFNHNKTLILKEIVREAKMQVQPVKFMSTIPLDGTSFQTYYTYSPKFKAFFFKYAIIYLQEYSADFDIISFYKNFDSQFSNDFPMYSEHAEALRAKIRRNFKTIMEQFIFHWNYPNS